MTIIFLNCLDGIRINQAGNGYGCGTAFVTYALPPGDGFGDGEGQYQHQHRGTSGFGDGDIIFRMKRGN